MFALYQAVLVLTATIRVGLMVVSFVRIASLAIRRFFRFSCNLGSKQAVKDILVGVSSSKHAGREHGGSGGDGGDDDSDGRFSVDGGTLLPSQTQECVLPASNTAPHPNPLSYGDMNRSFSGWWPFSFAIIFRQLFRFPFSTWSPPISQPHSV
jgi:hypothetical protein